MNDVITRCLTVDPALRPNSVEVNNDDDNYYN